MPEDPELALMNQASRRITGSDLCAGNDITILEGGSAAYPAMLDAIAAARHSVAMASYIFRNDAAGRQFTDALVAARGRGVTVKACRWMASASAIFSRGLSTGCAGAGLRQNDSCTPGCHGACPFSTCAITANCWWWMGPSLSWGMNIGGGELRDHCRRGRKKAQSTTFISASKDPAPP